MDGLHSFLSEARLEDALSENFLVVEGVLFDFRVGIFHSAWQDDQHHIVGIFCVLVVLANGLFDHFLNFSILEPVIVFFYFEIDIQFFRSFLESSFHGFDIALAVVNDDHSHAVLRIVNRVAVHSEIGLLASGYLAF